MAISADGNTAIAGAPADNGGIGCVIFYKRTGITWVQQGPSLLTIVMEVFAKAVQFPFLQMEIQRLLVV